MVDEKTSEETSPEDSGGAALSADSPEHEPTPEEKNKTVQYRGWLKSVADFVDDAKKVIAAGIAIIAAIYFALDYFATRQELNCIKNELKNNDEVFQTILQINELSSIWELESLTLERLNQDRQKAVKENRQLSDSEIKTFVEAKSRLEKTDSELKAARERRVALENKDVSCK